VSSGDGKTPRWLVKKVLLDRAQEMSKNLSERVKAFNEDATKQNEDKVWSSLGAAIRFEAMFGIKVP
jgi:hypothetical protein